MRCNICDYTNTECKSDYSKGIISKGSRRFMVTKDNECLCSECYNMIKSDLEWVSK